LTANSAAKFAAKSTAKIIGDSLRCLRRNKGLSNAEFSPLSRPQAAKGGETDPLPAALLE